MADRLIRGLSKNKELRFFIADVTDTAEKGRLVHDLSFTKAVIFGKLLCAGVIFGSDLKEENHLITIKAEFKNHEDYVIVTSNNKGRVKGYPHLSFLEKILANDHQDSVAINKRVREELRSLLKGGLFSVSKDIGLKNPYNGSTTLITGEIARDLTYYFSVSEQIPSIVGISLILNPEGGVKKDVGFMVQLMPEASDGTISVLEQNMRSLPEIIDLLEMGMTMEKIVFEMVLKDLEYEVTKTIVPEYYCDCSKARFEKGLVLLDREELSEMIKDGKGVPVVCHYCNKEYLFDVESIESILKRGS